MGTPQSPKGVFMSNRTRNKEVKIFFNDDEFNITFVGFCTDICVISNALLTKALFYDKANIFVDEKCCAGVTTEKHTAALEVMKSCQINVI